MNEGPDETHPDHDSSAPNTADLDESTLDKETQLENTDDKRTIKLNVDAGDMINLQCAEPHVRLKLINSKTGKFEEAKSLTYEEMAPLTGKVSFLVPESRMPDAMNALSALMDTGAILIR